MKFIEVSETNGIQNIVLNRENIHNAFNSEMIQELRTAFTSLHSQSAIRAVILSGRGKSFCSGADLGWMKSMAQYDFEANRKDSVELFQMFKAGWDCPVPIIGKVHGRIMGGGLGLLALCDVAVAQEDSLFCFSEVKLGLAPAVISPFVSQKMNSSSVHLHLLTGDVFSAGAAREAGLLHFIESSPVDMDQRVKDLTACFLKAGPEAVKKTKALIRRNFSSLDWDLIQDYTTNMISELRVGAEGQEGLTSFFEKRTASYVVSGKKVEREPKD